MRATTPARSTWSAPRGAFPHPPRTARPAGLAAVYGRRDPTATPLYPIVQHHLETFLGDAAEADPHGEGVPRSHLAGAVLRILLRAIRTTVQRTSPGAPSGAQLGAVSFLHRFGSALNPHFHFHVAVLDGLFSGDDDGALTFHEATQHLSAADVQRMGVMMTPGLAIDGEVKSTGHLLSVQQIKNILATALPQNA